MKTTQIIKANGAEYCNEFMETIPSGIINKKSTGCGLTTVALESQEPTIIVVPTQELIKNKVAQYPNKRFPQHIKGFYYGENKVELLSAYIKANKIPKILVTFDSFYRVAETVIQEFPDIEFKVVVDEFSEFLDAYCYRDEAIDSLRKNLKQFRNVSYISATPIKSEYLPKDMRDLDRYEIDWGEKLVKIQVKSVESTQPYKTTIDFIREYRRNGGYTTDITGESYKSTNAYFFINSVNDIFNIIKNADLGNDEVKIVCSSKEHNERKLQRFKDCMGSALDEEKTFNFVTSAAFKGVDFYSSTGLCFVVSNVHKEHTLTSIDTDLIQIAGRIRNTENPFRNKIYHIYNTGGKLTKMEIEKHINDKKHNTESFISLYNSVGLDHKKLIKDNMYNSTTKENFYLLYDEEKDSYTFNELAFYKDYRKFELIVDTYKNGINIIQRYEDSDITGTKYSHHTKGRYKNYYKPEYSYKELFEMYHTLHTSYAVFPIDADEIRDILPIVPEAIDTLGMDKIRKLNYSPVKIKRAIRNKTEGAVHTVNASRETKIMHSIHKEASKVFKTDTPYTGKEVKDKLLPIYGKFGLNRTPKGTDLHDIFSKVERKSIRELGNSKFYFIKDMKAS